MNVLGPRRPKRAAGSHQGQNVATTKKMSASEALHGTERYEKKEQKQFRFLHSDETETSVSSVVVSVPETGVWTGEVETMAHIRFCTTKWRKIILCLSVCLCLSVS